MILRSTKRKKLKKRNPFAQASETWYDLEYDRELIEQEELPYSEWLLLVGGIMEDTPLGQTVLIRKEKDRDRIKRFTPYETRIHNEWRNFIAKEKLASQKPEDFSRQFELMFAKMFG